MRNGSQHRAPRYTATCLLQGQDVPGCHLASSLFIYEPMVPPPQPKSQAPS